MVRIIFYRRWKGARFSLMSHDLVCLQLFFKYMLALFPGLFYGLMCMAKSIKMYPLKKIFKLSIQKKALLGRIYMCSPLIFTPWGKWFCSDDYILIGCHLSISTLPSVKSGQTRKRSAKLGIKKLLCNYQFLFLLIPFAS